MLFSLLTLPVAAALLLDLIRYRRGRISRLGLWFWIAADALPLWFIALFLLADNTPTITRLMMESIWLWMFLFVPRTLRAIFTAVRLPRLGIGIALLTAATLLYGAVWGRCNLRITHEEICARNLPAAFDGYRIAHFTDLHLGTLIHTEGEVGRLVERINALDPDLVCFTGDLVNIRHSELDARAMRLLQGIKAPVVSILGNHDLGTYIRDTIALPAEISEQRLIEQQQQMGWMLLQDSTRYLHRGADSISLTGLSFHRAQREDRHKHDLPMTEEGAKAYHTVPDSLYNITLVHIPQWWEQILALGYGDLTLAGHTHAMQLKLRLGKCRGWSPAAWLYERWSGRYDLNGSTLYINDGIGYVGYPMRIGARPEITLYTLKRCE